MNEAELLEIAGNQHGYFTTAQAEAAGISRRALSGRVRKGILEHPAHGLYRLPQYRATPLDEFYELQTIAPDATFSHDTALSLYEISDVLPIKIHLTIPPTSGMKPRPGVRLHRSAIDRRERVLRNGLWLTSPARTLLDCARAGLDPAQLLGAGREARSRAMLSRAEVEDLSSVYPFSQLRL